MSAAEACYYTLPDSPYNLWVRDELAALLHLPDDGTRVEVIGGRIVVSPGPTVGHNVIVQSIERSVFAAELTDPSFPWRRLHTTDLDLRDIQDGYIPDLIVLDVKIQSDAELTHATALLPRHVGLVVEVTSRWNAADDRMPGPRRSAASKWTGYARAGVGHYLLVDRDPRAAQSVLFSNPDLGSGAYRHIQSWDFGEVIRLPEPFGFEIPTGEWVPWSD